MKIRKLQLSLFTIFLLAWVFAPVPARVLSIGRVVAQKGGNEICTVPVGAASSWNQLEGIEKSALRRNDPLAGGTWIRTHSGGKVKALLDDDTMIAAGENSTFGFLEAATLATGERRLARIRLERGTIRLVVSRTYRAGRPLMVETPYGFVTITGSAVIIRVADMVPLPEGGDTPGAEVVQYSGSSIGVPSIGGASPLSPDQSLILSHDGLYGPYPTDPARAKRLLQATRVGSVVPPPSLDFQEDIFLFTNPILDLPEMPTPDPSPPGGPDGPTGPDVPGVPDPDLPDPDLPGGDIGSGLENEPRRGGGGTIGGGAGGGGSGGGIGGGVGGGNGGGAGGGTGGGPGGGNGGGPGGGNGGGPGGGNGNSNGGGKP
jgi:hypothetical protein